MTIEELDKLSTKDWAATVRRALRSKGFTGSVRMARGTAYGWLDIGGSGKHGYFTVEEAALLDSLRIPHGLNSAAIDWNTRTVRAVAANLGIIEQEDAR